MKRTIQSLIESELINRQHYVDQRNMQQAKLSQMALKTGCLNRKSGRVQAIQYWIDYWKGWIVISDAKLRLLNGK